MDLSLIIPVYNSREHLRERLSFISAFLEQSGMQYEIIPVDDGSTDGSDEILRSSSLPHVQPLFLEQNQGKFAAIVAAAVMARGNCCIFTDADIPFDPDALLYMLHLINGRGFHIVVGDRTLQESSYADDLGPTRRLATRYFTHFIRLFVTSGLRDTQCGLKGFRRDVAHALFPLLRERGFAGDVELLYIALKHNLEIRRIPVRLKFQGRSTVRPFKDGLAMLLALARIRLHQAQGLYESERLNQLARQDYWTTKQSEPRAPARSGLFERSTLRRGLQPRDPEVL